PPGRRRPRLVLAASVAIALALIGSLFLSPVQDFAQTVIRVATNKGVLEIKAHDKDLQITILQGGGAVVKAEVLLKNDQRAFEVTAVDGEIEVSERGPDGFGAKSKTPFHLTRGGKVVFTAEMLMSAAAPAPKDNPVGLLASFAATQQPISRDGVEKDQGGWRIEAKQPRTVRLFEVGRPGVEECLLIYRARMKTANLKGRAFLEMWCAMPGGLEFFSKGLLNPVSGSTDWATYEIPFCLEKGQKPESIKLNVTIEGTGTLWINDITLRKSPLPVSDQKNDAAAPAPKDNLVGLLASFAATQQPISRDGVEKDQGGWRIEAKQPRTVRLFEVGRPGVEECLLIYRARMKTANLKGRAFLEMWCALPGAPEFFSKG